MINDTFKRIIILIKKTDDRPCVEAAAVDLLEVVSEFKLLTGISGVESGAAEDQRSDAS